MKISIDFEDNNALLDLFDGLFVAHLKTFKTEIEKYLEKASHPDDIKMNNELISAVNLILKYYGENDGNDS